MLPTGVLEDVLLHVGQMRRRRAGRGQLGERVAGPEMEQKRAQRRVRRENSWARGGKSAQSSYLSRFGIS